MEQGVFSFDRPIDEAAQAYILDPLMARAPANAESASIGSGGVPVPKNPSPTAEKQESMGRPASPLLDPKTVLHNRSDDVSPVHSDLPEGPTSAVFPEHVRNAPNARSPEVQEVLAEITHLKERLQSLIAVEEEIVEAETWNFDASVMLSMYADKLGGIPFGTAADFYDMKPTSADLPSQNQAKGKEWDFGQATSPKPETRAVLNLDPKVSQDSWWATSLRKSLQTLEGSCSAPYFLFNHDKVLSSVPSGPTSDQCVRLSRTYRDADLEDLSRT